MVSNIINWNFVVIQNEENEIVSEIKECFPIHVCVHLDHLMGSNHFTSRFAKGNYENQDH